MHCFHPVASGTMRIMTTRNPLLRSLFPSLALLLFASPARTQPSPEALTAFRTYTSAVEARLDAQHRLPDSFLAAPAAHGNSGRFAPEQLPAASPPGALLHHWRASTFIAGARVADFERFLRDLDSYPRRFAPEILSARISEGSPSSLVATLRVQQKHVLTVVLDTTYAINLGRLDAQHGFSSSRSLRIQEIASPGTADERALAPDEDHGFLWNQNTYWSYAERDGGLMVQVESVSLSRSIPAGLDWIVRPFVQSIPRESLAFTLERTAAALRK